MKALSAICLAATLSSLSLSAQVVISEINIAPQSPTDDQWIELQNLGGTTANISSWSLYLSTAPNTNYWWGFLAGTSIGPGALLRVHWLAPVKPSTATDAYTGNLTVHFLFGLGAEPLPRAGGALALFNTQSNLKMSDKTIVEDWVSWGGNGWKREDLAVQNARWYGTRSVQQSNQLDSIALIESMQVEPTPPEAFFHDATPTPGLPNTIGAHLFSKYTPCSSGSLNGPLLQARSVPASGNRDFGLTLSPTVVGNRILFLFSVGEANIPVGACSVYVNPIAFFAFAIPTANGSTTLDIPLIGQPPRDVYVQAVQVPPVTNTTDYGLSNLLLIRIGFF